MREAFTLPAVIGHRGAAGYAPENTLAGFRKAAALGVALVEFDVRLTADGVPVLSHDSIPRRTLGHDRPIEESAYADLVGRDAGAWFGAGFAGERIPTLSQALGTLAGLGVGANLEVKPGHPSAAALIEAIGAAVAEAWPAGRPGPLVSSFDVGLLAEAARRLAHLPRGLNLTAPVGDWRRKAVELGCFSVHFGEENIGARAAEAVRKAGFRLAAFTVNDAVRARDLWAWGVDALFSDVPDILLAAARKAAPA